MSNEDQTNTIDISGLFDCPQKNSENGIMQSNTRISTTRLYFGISIVYYLKSYLFYK